MKKIFNEKNIMFILILLNTFIAVNTLMDYKTERLIDADSDILEVYIYKK